MNRDYYAQQVQLLVRVLPLIDTEKCFACAALDRQHPRDLFDVKFLLENEGFTESLRKTFLIFLISHQRPMVKLLAPRRKDIRSIYRSEFVQMAQVEVPVEELENIRETLIETIHTSLTGAEKSFLLSFKSRLPEWNLLGMDDPEAIQNLPSIRWKLRNLEQMPERKHRDSLQKLSGVLRIL